MSYFFQHQFERKLELLDAPSYMVTISPLALEKMSTFVDLVAKEVGWLGTCFDLGDGLYHISDVYLPTQEVDHTTTEIGSDAVGDLIMQLLDEKDGTNIVNNLRFWGHSHANMGTTPSGQDENQMDNFVTEETTHFLRGICNKHGKMQLSLFLYDQRIAVHDIPWTIAITEDFDGLREMIAAQIKERVTEIKWKGYGGGGYGAGGNAYGYWQGGRFIRYDKQGEAGKKQLYDPNDPESYYLDGDYEYM